MNRFTKQFMFISLGLAILAAGRVANEKAKNDKQKHRLAAGFAGLDLKQCPRLVNQLQYSKAYNFVNGLIVDNFNALEVRGIEPPSPGLTSLGLLQATPNTK